MLPCIKMQGKMYSSVGCVQMILENHLAKAQQEKETWLRGMVERQAGTKNLEGPEKGLDYIQNAINWKPMVF